MNLFLILVLWAFSVLGGWHWWKQSFSLGQSVIVAPILFIILVSIFEFMFGVRVL